MVTTGLNALALMRIEGIRLVHGGGRNGFGILLVGLLAIGAMIWAFSQSGRNEPAQR